MDAIRPKRGYFLINNKKYSVYEGVNTIGRNKDATVIIKDASISQQQAILVIFDEEKHYLSDFNSSNGTCIGSIKLKSLQLYEIGDAAEVTFALVNSRYFKLKSNIAEESLLNTQATQIYDDTVYNAKTQIFDDSDTNYLIGNSYHFDAVPINLDVINGTNQNESNLQPNNSECSATCTDADIHTVTTPVKTGLDASLKNVDVDIHTPPAPATNCTAAVAVDIDIHTVTTPVKAGLDASLKNVDVDIHTPPAPATNCAAAVAVDIDIHTVTTPVKTGLDASLKNVDVDIHTPPAPATNCAAAVAVDIHDMPTPIKRLSIHDLPTQILHEIEQLEELSINDMPTQILDVHGYTETSFSGKTKDKLANDDKGFENLHIGHGDCKGPTGKSGSVRPETLPNNLPIPNQNVTGVVTITGGNSDGVQSGQSELGPSGATSVDSKSTSSYKNSNESDVIDNISNNGKLEKNNLELVDENSSESIDFMTMQPATQHFSHGSESPVHVSQLQNRVRNRIDSDEETNSNPVGQLIGSLEFDSQSFKSNVNWLKKKNRHVLESDSEKDDTYSEAVAGCSKSKKYAIESSSDETDMEDQEKPKESKKDQGELKKLKVDSVANLALTATTSKIKNCAFESSSDETDVEDQEKPKKSKEDREKNLKVNNDADPEGTRSTIKNTKSAIESSSDETDIEDQEKPEESDKLKDQEKPKTSNEDQEKSKKLKDDDADLNVTPTFGNNKKGVIESSSDETDTEDRERPKKLKKVRGKEADSGSDTDVEEDVSKSKRKSKRIRFNKAVEYVSVPANNENKTTNVSVSESIDDYSKVSNLTSSDISSLRIDSGSETDTEENFAKISNIAQATECNDEREQQDLFKNVKIDAKDTVGDGSGSDSDILIAKADDSGSETDVDFYTETVNETANTSNMNNTGKLNDTDIIPATQDCFSSEINIDFKTKEVDTNKKESAAKIPEQKNAVLVNDKHDKNASAINSEEALGDSFQLALTGTFDASTQVHKNLEHQLIDVIHSTVHVEENPMETSATPNAQKDNKETENINIHEICLKQTGSTNEDNSFSKPTRITEEATKTNGKSVMGIMQSKQQIEVSEKGVSRDEGGDNMFEQPTQKISDASQGVGPDYCTNSAETRVSNKSVNDDDGLFLKPSRSCGRLSKEMATNKQLAVVSNDDDDIFQQATQKVSDTDRNAGDSTTKAGTDDDSIFFQPTQHVEGNIETESRHNLSRSDSMTTVDSDDDDSIFLQPTQQLQEYTATSKNRSDLSRNENDDSIFLKPTQVCEGATKDNSRNKKPAQPCNDDDFFMQPTQKIEQDTEHKTSQIEDNSSKIVAVCDEIPKADDDVFMQATQKLTEDNVAKTDKEVFNPPKISVAQFAKMNFKFKNVSLKSFDSIFLEATQKLGEDEAAGSTESKQPVQEEGDIFQQETQILSDENVSCRNKPEDIFLEPTQRIEDASAVSKQKEQEIFLEPTQIIDDASNNKSQSVEENLSKICSSPLQQQELHVESADANPDDEFIQSTQMIRDCLEEAADKEENVPVASTSFTGPEGRTRDELESQLEVMFASQNVAQFEIAGSRPQNPLVDVLNTVELDDESTDDRSEPNQLEPRPRKKKGENLKRSSHFNEEQTTKRLKRNGKEKATKVKQQSSKGSVQSFSSTTSSESEKNYTMAIKVEVSSSTSSKLAEKNVLPVRKSKRNKAKTQAAKKGDCKEPSSKDNLKSTGKVNKKANLRKKPETDADIEKKKESIPTGTVEIIEDDKCKMENTQISIKQESISATSLQESGSNSRFHEDQNLLNKERKAEQLDKDKKSRKRSMQCASEPDEVPKQRTRSSTEERVKSEKKGSSLHSRESETESRLELKSSMVQDGSETVPKTKGGKAAKRTRKSSQASDSDEVPKQRTRNTVDSDSKSGGSDGELETRRSSRQTKDKLKKLETIEESAISSPRTVTGTGNINELSVTTKTRKAETRTSRTTSGMHESKSDNTGEDSNITKAKTKGKSSEAREEAVDINDKTSNTRQGRSKMQKTIGQNDEPDEKSKGKVSKKTKNARAQAKEAIETVDLPTLSDEDRSSRTRHAKTATPTVEPKEAIETVDLSTLPDEDRSSRTRRTKTATPTVEPKEVIETVDLATLPHEDRSSRTRRTKIATPAVEPSKPTSRKTDSKSAKKTDIPDPSVTDAEVGPTLTRKKMRQFSCSSEDEFVETPKNKKNVEKDGGSMTKGVRGTPSTSRKLELDHTLDTPERFKRKQKPKVVFTMFDSPEMESLIRTLGGSVVDSVDACTVLVTGSVKRSQKLLTAVGQGKPICSPKWLQESKKSGIFLDPWDFILEDKEAEKKWKFSLKESLRRSGSKNLLEDYTIQLVGNNAQDVLKAAIEACGGKCVTRAPPKNSTNNYIVVSSADNKNKYSKFLKQNPPQTVVASEAIFDGVLRQELHFNKHLLT